MSLSRLHGGYKNAGAWAGVWAIFFFSGMLLGGLMGGLKDDVLEVIA